MIFLIIMINIMTLIITMADYLLCNTKIDDDLLNFIDDFYYEAELINEAKCYLINNHELKDLSLKKGIAYVKPYNNGYLIEYAGLNIYLETMNDILIDYIIK